MNLNVKPIYLGTFSVGLDKKFYRINRDDSPQKASLKLSMNPFLIQYDKKNIIIDPGLGDLDQESHIPALLEGLHEHGLSNDDITDVFLSHLHFDHIGGLANKQMVSGNSLSQTQLCGYHARSGTNLRLYLKKIQPMSNL